MNTTTPLPIWLRDELAQLRQEGRDVQCLEALTADCQAVANDEEKLHAMWPRLNELPPDPNFPYEEPNALAEIRALRPDGMRHMAFPGDADAMYERQYGAWLGRCIGCALGKPTECLMGPEQINGYRTKDFIKLYLQAISPEEYPLNNYFPEHSPAVAEIGGAEWEGLWCSGSMREHIAFMESDDDIRYTVIGQLVMKKHGANFTTADIANIWLDYLPYNVVCTAEKAAYRNIINRHEGQDWDWVASHENPWREWIGAAIRADAWGYAAPGWPELAADFAWRDARMSHVKNGIYGEMFAAAMIAAAFTLEEPLAIVEAGLAEIPRTSRLYQEMRWVIEQCQAVGYSAAAFETIHTAIYQHLGQYHPVHTINNAALVVSGLLLGGRDFEKVVTITVMGGLDTDCTGATAGSIAGAMLGAQQIPAKWKTPLHDTLNSGIADYHPIAISRCAQYSADIAARILE